NCLGLLGRQSPAGFPLGEADDELAARPDVTVESVPLHLYFCLGKCTLPSEDMTVNRIHQRAIQVEEQRVHGPSLPRLSPTWSPRHAHPCPTVTNAELPMLHSINVAFRQ